MSGKEICIYDRIISQFDNNKKNMFTQVIFYS